MVLLLCLSFLFRRKPSVTKQEYSDDHEAEERSRQSALLLLLPSHVIAGTIKERLPAVEYSRVLERMGSEFCKKDGDCVVCLGCMKPSDEVRELCDCSHLFHRECLDAWIDQGQITCPLCRSKLLRDHHGEKHRADPWRRERMIYLFGIKMPKPVREMQNHLAHVNCMVICTFLSSLPSLNSSDYGQPSDVSNEDRPSPLLVSVPTLGHIEIELIKKLPVLKFDMFLGKMGTQLEEEWAAADCAICLNSLEHSQEVRELPNCRHAFHSGCLNEWVGKGKVTCPMCRSKLLPDYHDRVDVKGGRDPWRLQRIAYLFGDDYAVAQL
ncbi:hypothetical protein RJ639_001746 [Escallonia herrerae]|uniref:RING-type domain-containing protein n=1 Tax=Escallonia herrerae TaxID=1293975 RepID=A0AA89BFN2_9ASTE|nr:hypothetical protein RJ639_001746 [Escallonia herrerae]